MSVVELMKARRTRHALERLEERYGVIFEASQIDWICHRIQLPHESDRDFKRVAVGINGRELWKVNIGLLFQEDLWIFCVYDSLLNQIITVLSREQGRSAARRMKNHRIRLEKRQRRMKVHNEHNRRVVEEFWLKTGRLIQWPINVLCN